MEDLTPEEERNLARRERSVFAGITEIERRIAAKRLGDVYATIRAARPVLEAVR